MLKGRVAVVTGASSGIGRATAVEIVKHGGKVVINARREPQLQELAAELNKAGEVHIVRFVQSDSFDQVVCAVAVGDATEFETLERAFDTAEQAFNQPADLVLLNAGRGLAGGILTSDEKKWEELIQLDYTGVLRGLRVSCKRLAKLPNAAEGAEGGKGEWLNHARDVVVIGSVVGHHVAQHVAVYGSTKAAVAYLGMLRSAVVDTRCLSLEQCVFLLLFCEAVGR